MNIENILKVASVIERAPHVWEHAPYINFEAPLTAFNMSIWHCDSIGCIGGWATQLLDGRNGNVDRVGELFGISYDEADRLCYPQALDIHYADVTPIQAARVLRHLAATGLVDWSLIEEAV